MVAESFGFVLHSPFGSAPMAVPYVSRGHVRLSQRVIIQARAKLKAALERELDSNQVLRMNAGAVSKKAHARAKKQAAANIVINAGMHPPPSPLFASCIALA